MDQLLVALDVDNAVHAMELAVRLQGRVGGIKIGSTLFTAEGPALVRRLVEQGHRVFLDLKFHDIPHQVAGAVASATKLGVWMMTVHASGGSEMLKAARRAAAETAAARNIRQPLVVAVTALTSLSDQGLLESGVTRSMERHVEELAALAERSGPGRGRRLAAGIEGPSAALSRISRSSRPVSVPIHRRQMTNRARSALARHWPQVRTTSSSDAPLLPLPIPGMPLKRSQEVAPDNLQQAWLPSLRRDEGNRPSRHSGSAYPGG